MRGFRYFVVAVLVSFFPLKSAGLSFGTPRPSATPAPSDDFYISEVAHDHTGEHADHAAAAPRQWEPMREIDHRALRKGQETYEVTRFPNQEPTPEQRRQAEDLVDKSRAAATRHGWFDYDKAAKDGFKRLALDDIHYVNPGYALDDVQLDPDRPEFLLFLDTPAGKRLAAFMFLARGPEDHGAQVGGPMTLWHYHAWADPVCLLERRIVVGLSNASGQCADGVPVTRSPEMMHVWLVKNPGGPFATSMSLTEDMRQELMAPVAR